MKSSKLISSSITMLFCLVSFGQEKNQMISSENNKGVRCVLSIKSQHEAIYVVDDSLVSKTTATAIDPVKIKKTIILDGNKGKALYGSNGKNRVIIIKTR